MMTSIKACHILAFIHPKEYDERFIAIITVVDAETGEIIEKWSAEYGNMTYWTLCDYVKNRAYDMARDAGFGQVYTFESNFTKEED